MKVGDVEIEWLGHAGFLIRNSRVIYVDPYNIPENAEKADFVLITHSHYDHCSFPDISKVVKHGTRIISPADCQSKIAKIKVPVRMEVIEPGQEMEFGDIKLSALPAYNTDKSFHQKDEQWVGYLIKMNGTVVYHAGDTDVIPEMKNLTGYRQANKKFVALLPVGGRFTMNAEEAAQAAKTIKPYVAVPMHYGTIIGNEEDAREFAEFCKEENINVEIMEKKI